MSAVRKTVPLPQLSPVLAVSGATECAFTDELHTTVRDVAWPIGNPWFSGDVSHGDNRIIAIINTTECPTAELKPLCSETMQELIPPFGPRQFPVARAGISHFSLAARGEAIVLHAAAGRYWR